MVTANKLVSGNTIQVIVCKNASSNTPNGTTALTLTMTFADVVTGTEFRKAFYDVSVDFAQGDYISMWLNVNSNVAEDIIVQLDCF